MTKEVAQTKNTTANWAIGLGISCIFLGVDIGLLDWITVITSIFAIDKAIKTKIGMAKGLIGLILGILYALVNAHKYGHI